MHGQSRDEREWFITGHVGRSGGGKQAAIGRVLWLLAIRTTAARNTVILGELVECWPVIEVCDQVCPHSNNAQA